MPKLVLLNGPPAIGKSTIARRYVDAHPLALNLDLDLVRSLLGGWIDQQEQSGTLARKIAIEMARVHLLAGYDVVVPQLLGRPAFIETLEHLAHEVSAAFHEIVLLDTKESAMRRFAERTDAHAQREIVNRAGGTAVLEQHYDALVALLATRPNAVTITARYGEADETYAELVRSLTA